MKRFRITVAASLAVAVLATSVPLASAQSPAPSGSPSPMSTDLAKDEAHLEGLEGEISSLGDRVDQLEWQKRATEAKRNEVSAERAKLHAATQKLLGELKTAERKLEHKNRALREAVAIDYKQPSGDALEILAGAGSASDALTKEKYRAVIEDKLETLSREADEAAQELERKKADYDSRKQELDLVTKQLREIEQGIVQQHAELSELLANRSNEALYLQERIARAKLAEEKILAEAGGNAIWGVFQEGAAVKQGDVIGFEGSTGFSTGCHTHFSVIKDGRWQNPTYFWSILRQPNGMMVQPYGMTDWARRGVYGGNIHNGIDVVQGCGKPVRAAADGVIVRDNRTDGSGFGHYIMIRHAGGVMTLYGHLI